MRRGLLLLSVALTFGAAAAAEESRPGGGIWKNVVPGDTPGEFNREDPMGLAAGVHIPTDCSINWVDADTGKRYCFASGTSLVYFQMQPKTNLAKARAFLADEQRKANTPSH
jgi:hypothetical protein